MVIAPNYPKPTPLNILKETKGIRKISQFSLFLSPSLFLCLLPFLIKNIMINLIAEGVEAYLPIFAWTDPYSSLTVIDVPLSAHLYL